MNAEADEVAKALAAFADAGWSVDGGGASAGGAPAPRDPVTERLTREVMASLRERPPAAALPAVPAPAPLSDPEWFKANPSRAVRLRERRPGDPEAHWLAGALACGGVLTVVRFMERDAARATGAAPPSTVRGLSTDILPLAALGGRPVVDSDNGILAALRASRMRR